MPGDPTARKAVSSHRTPKWAELNLTTSVCKYEQPSEEPTADRRSRSSAQWTRRREPLERWAPASKGGDRVPTGRRPLTHEEPGDTTRRVGNCHSGGSPHRRRDRVAPAPTRARPRPAGDGGRLDLAGGGS